MKNSRLQSLKVDLFNLNSYKDSQHRNYYQLNSVNILGIDINCISRDGILESILTWNSESKKRNIFYANAHNLNIASVNTDYFEVLNQADLVYPDGSSIVWASNLLGGCKLEKLSLIHWIDKLFEFIIQNNLRIYIIAGKPEIIPKAIKTILNTHPEVKITGYSSGYLTRKNQQKVFDEIYKIGRAHV